MSDNSESIEEDLTHRFKVSSANVDTILQHSVCSVRIIIVNRLEFELKLGKLTMESVVWSSMVPSFVAPKSIGVVHAHEPSNKVKDVAGSFDYQIFCKDSSAISSSLSIDNDDPENSPVALRLLNPMLASNAYAVDCPSSVQRFRFGGDNGIYELLFLA